MTPEDIIKKFIAKRGKPLTETPKPKAKKNGLTAAKRNELIEDLLTKTGYLTD